MTEMQKSLALFTGSVNPELAEDWDPVCGDRETRLCIIGRHMDPAKVTAQLDELLCDWTPEN